MYCNFFHTVLLLQFTAVKLLHQMLKIFKEKVKRDGHVCHFKLSFHLSFKHLKSRERDSPDAYRSWGWARLAPGTASGCPTWPVRTQVPKPVSGASQLPLAGSWNKKLEQENLTQRFIYRSKCLFCVIFLELSFQKNFYRPGLIV